MPVIQGDFFDGVKYGASYFLDREKDAKLDGVLNTGEFNVAASTGLSVDVSPGTLYVNGYRLYSQSTVNIVLDPADALQSRTDIIVAGADTIGLTGEVKVISGIPGGTIPSVPNNYYKLAEVLVPANAIVPSTIINKASKSGKMANSIFIQDASNIIDAADVEGALAELATDLKGTGIQTATLKHGQNKIITSKATPLTPTLTGKTLVNLLGKDGNCEDVSKWSNSANATFSLDSSNYKYGTNSLKIATTGNGASSTQSSNIYPIDNTKYYLLLGDVKNGNATNGAKIQVVTQSGGWVGESGTIVTDTSAFNVNYEKISPTALGTATGVKVNLYLNSTVTGQYAYVDGIRLYQIDQATYNLIDVDPNYTGDKLADKFPYVDSYVPLTNLAITSYGKNLLPPFSEWDDSGASSTTKTLINPYSFSESVTDNSFENSKIIRIPCLPNQTYTLSSDVTSGSYYRLVALNKDGVACAVDTCVITPAGTTVSITMPNDAVWLQIFATNSSGQHSGNIVATTGTFTFTNPMLNLGSTALPFEPQDKSYLYLPTRLCDGETLQEINGQWVKTKKVQHTVLDESRNWAYGGTSGAGYKRVQLLSPATPDGIHNYANSSCATSVKYDGKILTFVNGGTGVDQIDGILDTNLYWNISSADSGWGDAYTPTADEIKAYFYGWRMFIASGATNVPYNGTGTKAWGKIYCGIGTNDNGVVQNSGTTTLPTTMNDQGYTPYQLHYQLATPTTEVIQTEGSLALIEGDNQVEVGEGIVVREVIVPQLDTVNPPNSYEINTNGANGTTHSELKFRTIRILDVFKNGIKDTPNWVHITTQANGLDRVYIPQANYDPTATYTVTYLAQPYQLTCSSPDQSATYSTNDHTVLQSVVSDMEDISTRVSVLEETKADKTQPQWIAPTLLNGWVNYATVEAPTGYYKDSLGMVRIRGLISGGTITSGTTIFQLPSGYRPAYPEYRTTSIDGVAITLRFGASGVVQISNTNGKTIVPLDITFRAEQ